MDVSENRRLRSFSFFAFAVALLLVFRISSPRGILVAVGSCEGSGIARAMNITLLKALVAMVPICVLFFGSIVLFFRGKTLGSSLQLLGAGCLLMVVLTHFCEALHLFPWMHWGDERSVGHYFDFASAVLGLTLFPVGYLFYALFEQ
jgi:hypothetical protein